METLAFILGMLSIIGVMLVTAIIWGIVKIVKITRTIKHHEEYAYSTHNAIWTRFEEVYREINNRSENLERFISASNKEVLDTNRSYTDSRVDKLIDSISQTKTVIKG